MPHVEATASADRNADELWHEIGGFYAVGEWHPMLARVEGDGEEPGALRTAETHDHQLQVERLLAMDPANHHYRYQMTSTKLPVENYVGDFSIRSDDADHSRIIWAADFDVTSGDPNEVVDAVQQFLDAGVVNIQRRYG
jgi:hypothetical protein